MRYLTCEFCNATSHAETTLTLHSQILSMWDTCVNLHPARQLLQHFLYRFARGPALFPLITWIILWRNKHLEYLLDPVWGLHIKHQVYSNEKIAIFWKMTDHMWEESVVKFNGSTEGLAQDKSPNRAIWCVNTAFLRYWLQGESKTDVWCVLPVDF